MTHRHHHHHHRHAGRQLRSSVGSRRTSGKGDADFEQEVEPNYESGFADRVPTINSYLGPEVPGADSFAGPQVAHDLGRREEVTQTLTAVVATVFDVIIESGTQTIAQVTVTSLPAVVSIPNLGTVSIPAASSPPAPIAVGIATTINPTNKIPLGTSSLSPSNSQLTPQIVSSTQLIDSTTLPASPTEGASSTPSPHVDNIVSTSSLTTTLTAIPSVLTRTLSLLSSQSELSTTAVATTSAPALALSTPSPSSSISGESSTGISQSSPTTPLPSTGVSTESPTGASPTSAGSTVYPLSSPSSSSASSAGGSSDVGRIVGGVVGGVAGFLVILLLAFLLLRWRKRQTQPAGNIQGGFSRGIQATSGPRSAEMASQRSSNTPLAASAVLGRWASSSSRRSGWREDSYVNPGERGFQKISGRKIPSVLHTGGDGYGDEIEEENYSQIRTPPLEATSPVSPISAIGGGGNHRHAPMRDDAIAAGIAAGNSTIVVMRPSPARTPTASSIDLMAPSQASQRGVSPMRPDPLGRTLSRYDGSRGSRFTEGI